MRSFPPTRQIGVVALREGKDRGQSIRIRNARIIAGKFAVIRNVDDFVAGETLTFIRIQQHSKPPRNENKTNHLEPPNYGIFQQEPESGSGPGGRRFKSSLPDQSFQVRPGHMGNRMYRLHG